MISAIILAAGSSTRFGGCKQLMRLEDKTLLERVLENVSRSTVEQVILVLGAQAETIRKEVPTGGATVVINEAYAEGLSSSLQAGLRVLPSTAEAALIVLADQPFVSPRTLDTVIAEYREHHPAAVIPTYNGFRGNPVLVDRSLFGEIMGIRGDIGCRAVFGTHTEKIRKVAVDDPGIVQDIDTPEDFERARGAHPAPEESKTTTMPEDLLNVMVRLRRRGEPFAVATVVRSQRPTSAKPGAKAIITADGSLLGWVGGSCARETVITTALETLRDGAPRFLTLSNRETASGKREGIVEVPMPCYSGGVLDIFIEPHLPPPQLVVLGYEAIAAALVRIGQALRFQITVIDPVATREALPQADRVVNTLNLPSLPMTSSTSIVIATHGRFDEDALEQALRTSASYIALVASRKRAGVILQRLRERGIPHEALSRVKSPAGLDIGAATAEEIALSIMAEIVQESRRGAAKENSTETPPRPTAEAQDPICGMLVTVATARYTSEYRGEQVYFCCEACKRTFDTHPDRYVKRSA